MEKHQELLDKMLKGEAFTEIAVNSKADEEPGISMGTFPSPVAKWLPKERKIAHVMLVVPEGEVKGSAISVAATSDHGFSSRRKSVALCIIADP